MKLEGIPEYASPMTQIITPPRTRPAPRLAARYTRTAIVLHWIIAALITVSVVLGLTADALPEDWIRPAIDLHKSFGLTVLGLVLARILWRLSHPAPPLPGTMPRLERIAAHAVASAAVRADAAAADFGMAA